MLQELLNLGLLDIGSDDSRFAKMESASTRLSKKLEGSLPLMITATLVAIDENIHEDEPFFDLVEDLVIAEWKTLRNTHVNRPRTLLRAITISALREAVGDSPERSSLVWNTACSRLTHDQTSLGKSWRVLTDFLELTFSTSEREALRRAGIATLAPGKRHRKRSAASKSDVSSPTGNIAVEDLLTDVARAAGPQTQNQVSLANPNPHWTNAAQHWSYEFTPRMTEALVKAVNLGTMRLAESITSELAAQSGSIDDVLGHLESIQSKLSESEAASRMRLEVLWWAQAGYSPSQNGAYSKLPAAAAALAAAADLSSLVPSVAPASVAHVLGEAMADFVGDARIELIDHLRLLNESPPVGLDEMLPTGSMDRARVPLIKLVAEAARGRSVSNEDLKLRAGVDPSLRLDAAELAMWLFRELQAQRIAEGDG